MFKGGFVVLCSRVSMGKEEKGFVRGGDRM